MTLKDFLKVADTDECVFTIQDNNPRNLKVLQSEMPVKFINSDYLNNRILSIMARDWEFIITIEL